MKRTWFVYHKNYVRGPFSTEEVDNGLAKQQIDETSIIWWRGQKHWISLKKWKSSLTEITRTMDQEDPPVWFVQANGMHKGPMPKAGLVAMLGESPSVDRFKIWKDGFTEWKSVFEVSEVLHELGLSPRSAPRVPFSGTVHIELPHQSIEAPLTNLSSGGFGIANTPMPTNQIVKVTIKGDELSMPVKANAEVVYSTKSGYTGFRFDQIHIEAQSTIVDYVRKVENAKGEAIFENKSLAILAAAHDQEATQIDSLHSEPTVLHTPDPSEVSDSTNYVEVLETEKKAA